MVAAEQAFHAAREAAAVNTVEKQLYIAEGLVGPRAPDLAGAREILRADRSARGAAQALIAVGRVARPEDSRAVVADAVHAVERMVRDVVVLRCSAGIPPRNRGAFLIAAEMAFGAEWHNETLKLSAQLLLAYTKVMGTSTNAFQSNSQLSAQKRGRQRPPRRRPATSQLPRVAEEAEPLQHAMESGRDPKAASAHECVADAGSPRAHRGGERGRDVQK